MKTIEVEETVTTNYVVGDWSMGRVFVAKGRDVYWTMAHERDIPKDWPEEVKQACLIEIVPNRELAENEIRTADAIWQLRWHDGDEQCRYALRGSFRPLADNEFIDSEGRKWVFELRDDGDANIYKNSVCEANFCGNSRDCSDLTDWSRAALAYRDKERARWTLEYSSDGHVWVTKDGECAGAYKHIEHRSLEYAPTWVREKARKMWEERQKPMRVEFLGQITRTYSSVCGDGEIFVKCGYGDAGNAGMFLGGKRVRVTIEEVE
jgi:hypothetical protein